MSDVDANLQQIDMIGEIVYLSARHYHTEITLAEVNGFLTVQNMMELAIIILGLSGFKDEPKKKAEVTATPSP